LNKPNTIERELNNLLKNKDNRMSIIGKGITTLFKWLHLNQKELIVKYALCHE